MKSIKGNWIPLVDMENSTEKVCCLILVRRGYRSSAARTSRRRGEDFYFPRSEALPILEGNIFAKRRTDAVVEKYFALSGGEK